MRKIYTLILLFIVGYSAITRADVPLDIIRAEFGIFESQGAHEVAFTPTDKIPLRVGQRYGWVITIRSKKAHVSVIEEYISQSAPSVRSVDETALTLPLPRRTQVSQRELSTQAGYIMGDWEIGPLEPAGKRILEVSIDGEVRAHFEFEVQSP